MTLVKACSMHYTLPICKVGNRGSQGNCSEPQADGLGYRPR